MTFVFLSNNALSVLMLFDIPIIIAHDVQLVHWHLICNNYHFTCLRVEFSWNGSIIWSHDFRYRRSSAFNNKKIYLFNEVSVNDFTGRPVWHSPRSKRLDVKLFRSDIMWSLVIRRETFQYRQLKLTIDTVAFE